MNMKKLFTFALILSSLSIIKAQDESTFTHTMVNPFIVNPGYTGITGDHQIMFHMRNSWSGFKNAPNTYAVSWNGPVADRLGMGTMFLSDNAGLMNKYRGQLSFGYNFYANKNFKLGIGLSTELHQERLRSSFIDNPLYEPGDDLIDDRLNGAQWFDATAGIYGDYRNILYFGLSTANMIRAKLNDIRDSSFAEEITEYWNFQLGYRFNLLEHDVIIEPSVFIRHNFNAPTFVDLGLRASFLNQRVTGGLLYRAGSGGMLGLLIGTSINTFRVQYSYDIGLQRFQEYSSGSHEITIGFSLMGKAKKKALAAAAETPPK